MTDDISVVMLGLDTHHTPEFVYNWSNRDNAYVFLSFSTPFYIRTSSGFEIGRPGDCILHDPSFDQYHTTPKGMSEGFRNDWIHLRGNGIARLVEKYEMPLNSLIHADKSNLLTSQIRLIEEELLFKRPFQKDNISLLVEEMFLQVSRHMKLKNEFTNVEPDEKDIYRRFVEVHNKIHNQYYEEWSVDKMAALLSLSTSRFSVLYKKFFDISPKEDLLKKRIDEAKILLMNSSSSVEVIALNCGFKNIYYFSSIFKKRTNFSPSMYRNWNGTKITE